jgi:hypothetical protein
MRRFGCSGVGAFLRASLPSAAAARRQERATATCDLRIGYLTLALCASPLSAAAVFAAAAAVAEGSAKAITASPS